MEHVYYRDELSPTGEISQNVTANQTQISLQHDPGNRCVIREASKSLVEWYSVAPLRGVLSPSEGSRAAAISQLAPPLKIRGVTGVMHSDPCPLVLYIVILRFIWHLTLVWHLNLGVCNCADRVAPAPTAGDCKWPPNETNRTCFTTTARDCKWQPDKTNRTCFTPTARNCKWQPDKTNRTCFSSQMPRWQSPCVCKRAIELQQKTHDFSKTNHPGKGNNGGLGGLMEDLISTQITAFLVDMPGMTWRKGVTLTGRCC